MKKTLLLFIAAIALSACSDSYSSGERTGTIVKFSRKGMIYSTWEGDLNMGGLVPADQGGGMVPNIWSFSLDEEHERGENIKALSDSINKALQLNKRVTLHYNQELNTDWNSSRGETQYYVDKVTIIYK